MGLYNKSSIDLVIDLINNANQSLPFEVTASDFNVSDPQALGQVIPGTIQNTSIKLIARHKSLYRGELSTTYRRLDISRLFRGVQVRVLTYSAAAAHQTPVRMHQVIDALNRRYGLNLTAADVVDVAFPARDAGLAVGKRTSVQVLKITPSSVGYTGEVSVIWEYANRSIDQVTPGQDSTDERTYPGGNDFSTGANHPVVLNLWTYGRDWTENSAALTAVPTTLIAGNTASIALVNLLNQSLGTSFVLNSQDLAQPNNLHGFTAARAPLPSGTYPQANSTLFNRILALTPGTSNTWAAGRMFLHYNA